MKNSKRLLALAVAAACTAPLSAFATNGMDLEGYGPIATAMGGASMAYDNGTAAMMNNPATLGLMSDGNRLDLALGEMSPDVKTSYPAMSKSWSSSADAFFMPAVGWAKKNGQLTWGVGAFAQGGMGTQYDHGGPGTAFTQMTIQGAGGNPAMVSSWRERSEVGVMRLLVPIAYNVNDQLTVGGSIDYVHASMDLQMAMPYGSATTGMAGMMAPGGDSAGKISGTIVQALPGMSGMTGNIYGGYFNFTDNSPYTGKASAGGFAAKIGFTYVVNPSLTIGGVYQSETSLGDLSGSGSMALATQNAGVVTLSGDYKVKNFQWPATYGLGLSYKPNSKWMVAADVKQIQWSEVMKNFHMVFTGAGNTGAMAGMNGADLDAVMYQNWKDQTVVEVGGAYAATDAWTLRAGVNLTDNPIPNSTVNYLFPAIIENSYTAGFGYAINKASDVNFSLSIVPQVSVTGTNPASNQGLKITHSQTNWQLMYSHRF